MSRAKRVNWSPCTPDFAHNISGLEVVRTTQLKRGTKTTWYTRIKHTGKLIPLSYRIFSEEAGTWNEGGYNKDFFEAVRPSTISRATRNASPETFKYA